MRELKHDAFARESLIRETVQTLPGTSCIWCGGKRKPDKKGNFYLFAYGIEPDSAPFRRSFARGLFCSVGCFRAFHNV